MVVQYTNYVVKKKVFRCMGSGYKTDKNRKLRGFHLLTSKTKREMKKLLVNKKLNNNNKVCMSEVSSGLGCSSVGWLHYTADTGLTPPMQQGIFSPIVNFQCRFSAMLVLALTSMHAVKIWDCCFQGQGHKKWSKLRLFVRISSELLNRL